MPITMKIWIYFYGWQNKDLLAQFSRRAIVSESNAKVPYPLDCKPGVLFFKMDFWVGFNSKYPWKSGLLSKKVGFYSRKPQKPDFSHYVGLYSRVGLHSRGYSLYYKIRSNFLIFSPQLLPSPLCKPPTTVHDVWAHTQRRALALLLFFSVLFSTIEGFFHTPATLRCTVL